jgi:hypothetical protein
MSSCPRRRRLTDSLKASDASAPSCAASQISRCASVLGTTRVNATDANGS